MNFNPVISLPLLVPLAFLVVAVGAWLAWKSNLRVNSKLRRLLTSLRMLALCFFVLLLFNPGKWQPVQDTARTVWAVMVDTSESMTTPDSDGKARWDAARGLAEEIGKKAKAAGVDVELVTFDSSTRPVDDAEGLVQLKPNGTASDLVTSCSELISQITTRGDQLAGVIALTDGRQTVSSDPQETALRARAAGVEVHGVLIGGDWAQKDLSVGTPRRSVVAFPGQKVQLAVLVENKGLGNIRPQVGLTNADGKVVETRDVIIPNNASQVVTFSLDAPEASTQFTVRVPKMEGERVDTNNVTTIRVSLLTTRTRVFIAEGAPYWDSKFLAQLLRQQAHVTVNSVYRISDERFFRIASGDSGPAESLTDVFPDTAEALDAYDLIIFGKGAEHFVTPERAVLLRDFVREKGGAVLFSRGRPAAGNWDLLQALEPVLWGAEINGALRFEPSEEGEIAGLFGQSLPFRDDSVWQSLPTLKDARLIDSIKPFTRVLAYGTNSAGGSRTPLLLVRRYGQGAVGLVNADGLWTWDFYPEARELGNMYLEFWSQMTQWLMSYAEFLPGEDYALHPSASELELGKSVNLRALYRGAPDATPATLRVRAMPPAGTAGEPVIIGLGQAPDENGRLVWRGRFDAAAAGMWTMRLLGTDDQAVGPEVALAVSSPPGEMSELAADADFLARFTTAAGGKMIAAEKADELIAKIFTPKETAIREAGSIWEPLWSHWWVPVLMMIPLGGEWWLRRRNGLL